MKAGDCGLWTFKWEPVHDDDQVKCPHCNTWSPLADWTEGFVGCDSCGDHSAMECPVCGEGVDHVHQSSEPLVNVPLDPYAVDDRKERK